MQSRVGFLGLFFFFFQAEDGIRDLTVTGVQTCALPISCGVRNRTDSYPQVSRLSPNRVNAGHPAKETPWKGQLWLRRSEEHTSELQSQSNLVCRLLLEKKKHYV